MDYMYNLHQAEIGPVLDKWSLGFIRCIDTVIGEWPGAVGMLLTFLLGKHMPLQVQLYLLCIFFSLLTCRYRSHSVEPIRD